MNINADLFERVVIQQESLPWLNSPVPGIQRRLLERDADEQARATSIVRYAPGAHFTSHVHYLGEEFFVLDGVFEDDHGSYGPGTWVKNPPGSFHSPRSQTGSTLFVKLHHLEPDDRERHTVNTRTAHWHPGLTPGIEVMPLYEFGTQHTALVRWLPGTRFNAHRHYGGEEIYVLEGTFQDEHGRYPRGTWIRSPHLSQHHPFSEEGCVILVKTGHLPSAATQENTQ